MNQPYKLTIAEIAAIIANNEYEANAEVALKQLADTVRENERLREALMHLRGEIVIVMRGNCSRTFDKTMDEVNVLLQHRGALNCSFAHLSVLPQR